MAEVEGKRAARRERLARSAKYADLEKEIMSLLAQNFETSISGVHITEGTGSEGETILRVMVVLGERKPSPDGRQLLNVIQSIRTCVGGDEPFPIVSFVSRADADRLRVEAA